MPSIHLLGGLGSGHSCYPPHNNVQASPNVNVNGIPVHRQGDMWAVHVCGNSAHASVLAKGSSTVYVNGKQCARLGDPVACGSVTVDGSANVFAGG